MFFEIRLVKFMLWKFEREDPKYDYIASNLRTSKSNGFERYHMITC